MALLALTPENLDHLKFALRSAYPDVKPSHRVEALAAACGFRTNISLRSNLKTGVPEWPDLKDVNPGRFVARLAELGYPDADGGTITGLVQLPDMPDRIWVSCKSDELMKLDDWFSECRRRDIPYVYVTKRRKYADIDWDCISTDNRHDDVTRHQSNDELVRHMFRTFQSIAHGQAKKAMFQASSFVGGIKDIPMDIAPELADAMFSILYEAIKLAERQRRTASATATATASR